jgi:hypothetical protein
MRELKDCIGLSLIIFYFLILKSILGENDKNETRGDKRRGEETRGDKRQEETRGDKETTSPKIDSIISDTKSNMSNMSNKAICEIDQAWEDFGKIDFTTSLYQQMGYDTEFEIDPAWEDFGKPVPEEEWKVRNEEWKAQDEVWKVQDEEWQARIDVKNDVKKNTWEVRFNELRFNEHYERMLRDKDLRSRCEERQSRIDEVNKFRNEEIRLMLTERRKVRDEQLKVLDEQWKVLDKKWKARLDELMIELMKDEDSYFDDVDE